MRVVHHRRVCRAYPEQSPVHHFRQRVEKAAIRGNRLVGEIVKLVDRETVGSLSYSRPDPEKFGIDAAELGKYRKIEPLHTGGRLLCPLQNFLAEASPRIVGR